MPSPALLSRSTNHPRPRRKPRAKTRRRARLQNITGYKGVTQIQGHAYLYDTIGNVTIVADGPGSQLEIRGGYDALNRLTQIDTWINGVASSSTQQQGTTTGDRPRFP